MVLKVSSVTWPGYGRSIPSIGIFKKFEADYIHCRVSSNARSSLL